MSQYDVSQYFPYLLWRKIVKIVFDYQNWRPLLSTKGLEGTYHWCICSRLWTAE